MPRINRVIAPGFPHHITQRGNHRERVFYRDEDRKLYLNLVSEFLPYYGVAVEAYCLLSNHVHLVATPHDRKGLSLALQRVHSDYSRALHLRLRQSGHLWQARFHSTALDEEHYWATMIYVEQNPVRAGLTQSAAEWRWSSARAHLGLASPGFLNLVRWRQRFDPTTWEQSLSYGLGEAAQLERIREATRSGFPLGDNHFRTELEQRFAVKTAPGKPGRPKKPRAEEGQPKIQAALSSSTL
jgi:putative transposase